MDVRGQLSRFVLGRLRRSGVLVLDVDRGTGAADAGLRGTDISRDGRRVTRVGDIILAIDGEPIASRAELRAVLDRYRAGDEVTVTILRGSRTREVAVRLS